MSEFIINNHEILLFQKQENPLFIIHENLEEQTQEPLGEPLEEPLREPLGEPLGEPLREPLEEPLGETVKNVSQTVEKECNKGFCEEEMKNVIVDPAYPICSRKILFNVEDQQYTFLCPHCNLIVAVEKNQVNCHIFRHGNFIIMRDQVGRAIMYGDSIPPHSSKQVCDELVERRLIVGCGKPIQMYTNSDGEYYVRICDYI